MCFHQDSARILHRSSVYDILYYRLSLQALGYYYSWWAPGRSCHRVACELHNRVLHCDGAAKKKASSCLSLADEHRYITT